MKTTNDIAHWRTKVFSSLLSTVAKLGTGVALASIGLAINERLWPVAIMDTLAMVWLLVLWRMKRIPYRVRVLNFLVVLYLIGIGLMLTVGPVSQIYLMAPPVLAVVFLGLWPAVKR